jgi:hypothetical protein
MKKEMQEEDEALAFSQPASDSGAVTPAELKDEVDSLPSDVEDQLAELDLDSDVNAVNSPVSKPK